MRWLHIAGALTVALVAIPEAVAFTPIYVTKDGAPLPTLSPSSLVLVRDGDRTTVTITVHDHRETTPLLMIIPVPKSVSGASVKFPTAGSVGWLEERTRPSFSMSRDARPCESLPAVVSADGATITINAYAPEPDICSDPGGWTVETGNELADHYYPWSLLSSDESAQIESWLSTKGHRVPAATSELLAGYARRGAIFLVVDLTDSWRARRHHAIQFSYEAPVFSIPFPLIDANARGDVIVHTITRLGSVEPTNVQTVRLPTNKTVPQVDQELFYSAMLEHEEKKHEGPVVFTEYVGAMRAIDRSLGSLGVSWEGEASVTRFRVRVSAEPGKLLPDEIVLRTDSTALVPYQARYFMHVPFERSTACGAPGAKYRRELRTRKAATKRTLLELTGRTEIAPAP